MTNNVLMGTLNVTYLLTYTFDPLSAAVTQVATSARPSRTSRSLGRPHPDADSASISSKVDGERLLWTRLRGPTRLTVAVTDSIAMGQATSDDEVAGEGISVSELTTPTVNSL